MEMKFLIVLSLVLMFACCAHANEIGIDEDFALSSDRESVLKKLVPGTEEYYYFNCIHLMNSNQLEKCADMLRQWKDRYGSTARAIETENRLNLLSYPKNEQATLAYLKEKMSLYFSHSKILMNQKPGFQTRLDENYITHDKFLSRAFSGGSYFNEFEESGIYGYVDQSMDPDKRREFLKSLTRPIGKNLPAMIIEDLRYERSGIFGSLPIHNKLTLEQLDECLRLMPMILKETNFINCYISRLMPGADTNGLNDRAEKTAFLERLWKFALRLPMAQNSLKAHVLYNMLKNAMEKGEYDKNAFIEYLKLPRNGYYINPEFLNTHQNREYRADISIDFSSRTSFPAIGNDEPLVRQYLRQLFLEDSSAESGITGRLKKFFSMSERKRGYTQFFEELTEYIEFNYLNDIYAETRLTSGQGDMEQWFSLLTPDKVREIRERVELDFLPHNPEFFMPEDNVTLDLTIKNVPTLIVKIYRINTLNFYRENNQEITTAIDLDGLYPNEEKVQKYDLPEFRRHSEKFEFPGLKEPGVYVIEFIGGGKSCRALVRKGRLSFTQEITSAGHIFSIFDENRKKLKTAEIFLAGHHYKAKDDSGEILVPFSSSPREQSFIIKNGNFAAFHNFTHLGENYSLTAAFYADRESLIDGAKAKIVVRPVLSVNGVPVDIDLLKETSLTVSMLDRNDISTVREIKKAVFKNDQDTEFEMKIPEKLETLNFTIKGKVDSLTTGKPVDLSVQGKVSINGIDRTGQMEDIHFSRFGRNYFLEVLGKTGEPKPERPVNIEFKHKNFRCTLSITLQTDEKGRIELGELTDIEKVFVSTQTGCSKFWYTMKNKYSLPSVIHDIAGNQIKIPGENQLMVFELRNGNYFSDCSKNVVKNGNLNVIEALSAGDYEIFDPQALKTTLLRLTAGEEVSGQLISEARILRKIGDEMLDIAETEISEKTGKLRIKISNSNEDVRLHIAANRFLPDMDIFDSLGVPTQYPYPGCAYWTKPATKYVSGRTIGDEYQYILERKFARIFPGLMLKRPGLLLNPFSIRKTDTGTQQAARGDSFEAMPEAAPFEPVVDCVAQQSVRDQGTKVGHCNLDFLASSSKLFFNLKPDSDGNVTIDLKEFADRQHIQIYAVSDRDVVYSVLSLNDGNCSFKDLRLANTMDLTKHFSETKRITDLASGTTLQIDDITTAKFEAFDSLERVFALFSSLKNDQTLAEFNFILGWPELKLDEKKKLYSKYACHELNFFLFKKDPEFFKAVVKPYITDKYDRTFLDKWLIEADLSDYLAPWAYQRLNVVERILLADRYPERVASTARHIKDLYDLIPPDIEKYNMLFETALKTGSLETADRFGFDDAKDKAVKFAACPPPPAPVAKPQSIANFASGLSASTEIEKDGASMEKGQMFEDTACESDAPSDFDESSSEEKREMSAKSMSARSAAPSFKKKSSKERMKADSGRRQEARAFYRALEKTEEYVENNYYKLPIQSQLYALIKENAFWKDFAGRDRNVAFISENIGEASGNFTEMMFALSVLDLPFKSTEHKVDFDKIAMKFQSLTPSIIFHREIKPSDKIEKTQTILTSQNFFLMSDRYRYENNERLDKFITEEFQINRVYGCQVTLTNPSSARRKVDLLMQIPAGSLPVMNGFVTKSVHLQLDPYSTKTFEYYFYFPQAGTYMQYPVHVSGNEKILAFSDPFKFIVVDTPTKVDDTSWDYISQNADDKALLKYLDENNINRLDLEKIAFRMKDPEMFKKIIQLLDSRHVFNPVLWSYSVFHNQPGIICEYLKHQPFAQNCGSSLDCLLLKLDPVARHVYEHKEYLPLVNARVYQLGKKRKILNQQFFDQYKQLLSDIKFHAKLSDHDRMAVTYYMFLQDRVEDAMNYFNAVTDAGIKSGIQYKYFKCCFAFMQEKIQEAVEIASKLTDYKVDKWRDLFRDVIAQAEETSGKAGKITDQQDRDQAMANLADTEPLLNLAVESGKIEVGYKNIDSVTLNFYIMDIELLFSKNPFVQEVSGQFSIIQPNETLQISLPAGKASCTVEIPETLKNRNIFVEAVSLSTRKTASYYPNTMDVQVLENYGQVKVVEKSSGKCIQKAYIKVFARMNDGSVNFYKDGYTDIRGRFDYTSLSTNELDNVQKFSILIITDRNGSLVREANPPKR
ncbi:MAG: hypothetical protein HQM10_17165 [Candidatus Riflebacteria bacterium]|nr:hypothetical protein [Candidatus Riflebacteria bacterium]